MTLRLMNPQEKNPFSHHRHDMGGAGQGLGCLWQDDNRKANKTRKELRAPSH